MTNEIKTIFERLETFKGGYLNHYYTQIAGGGYVLLDDIAKLKDYIMAIETPEPLTDEEREKLRKYGWVWDGMERFGRWEMWLKENGYHVCCCGIGRTKAEAERDAYNQLKEAKLI